MENWLWPFLGVFIQVQGDEKVKTYLRLQMEIVANCT